MFFPSSCFKLYSSDTKVCPKDNRYHGTQFLLQKLSFTENKQLAVSENSPSQSKTFRANQGISDRRIPLIHKVISNFECTKFLKFVGLGLTKIIDVNTRNKYYTSAASRKSHIDLVANMVS